MLAFWSVGETRNAYFDGNINDTFALRLAFTTDGRDILVE